MVREIHREFPLPSMGTVTLPTRWAVSARGYKTYRYGKVAGFVGASGSSNRPPFVRQQLPSTRTQLQ
jgi:hypothetical protein